MEKQTAYCIYCNDIIQKVIIGRDIKFVESCLQKERGKDFSKFTGSISIEKYKNSHYWYINIVSADVYEPEQTDIQKRLNKMQQQLDRVDNYMRMQDNELLDLARKAIEGYTDFSYDCYLEDYDKFLERAKLSGMPSKVYKSYTEDFDYDIEEVIIVILDWFKIEHPFKKKDKKQELLDLAKRIVGRSPMGDWGLFLEKAELLGLPDDMLDDFNHTSKSIGEVIIKVLDWFKIKHPFKLEE